MKAIEKERAGKRRHRFQESTAVFQPEYTGESAPTAISPENAAADRRWPNERAGRLQRSCRKSNASCSIGAAKVFEEGGPYEWHYAEALAFGSLLLEGIPVRLVRPGQLVAEHSALVTRFFTTRKRASRTCRCSISRRNRRASAFTTACSPKPRSSGSITVTRSIIPNMLCLWEAQFGDFANGAQTIIDQFIVPAESKWQRPSGIVLLLPHGYEGQGPEHSSARLERFLQACAEDNIQVCNLTTSAQYFHVLRRQMKRDFVKPLIIMTPKSLLRSEQASLVARRISRAEVRGDPGRARSRPAGEDQARHPLLGQGLLRPVELSRRRRKSRTRRSSGSSSFIRSPKTKLRARAQSRFAKRTELVWCQEESQNMGAWTFIEPRLRELFRREIPYAGRNASASPAVGALAIHKREQARLVKEAFAT